MSTGPEQFRDPQLETNGGVIGFYPREFYVFDNFSAFQVDYEGRRWATSEHAYQGAKFLTSAATVADKIQAARSPHDAKRIAADSADRVQENWSDIKLDVMYEICKLKVLQNEYVWEKLSLSGEGTENDWDIVEDSPKDDFWGLGSDKQGQNHLGKIWMRLRSEQASGELTLEEHKS